MKSFISIVVTAILAGGVLAACSVPAPVAAPANTPVAASVPAATPVDGALFVDAGQALGPISPLIFGSNYGPWVSLRPETLPLAETSGVTMLRYPGGAHGDQNTLQTYQIDQLVDLARRMDAEPYIHVRFIGGTPETAAANVQYANVDKGYGIRYWSIGNEPSLYEPAGEPWDAQQFADEWRNFAAAMKTVDPTILLIGPETHQFTGTPDVDPKDSAGRDWLRTFLATNGDLVDIVSVHRYPFPNNAARTPATPAELLADPPTWTELVRNLRRVIREETGKELPVAITEMNSHWSNYVGGETSPDSFLSGLWLGDVLGRLVAERVDVVNQFLLVGTANQGFGLLGRSEPRPAYYPYQLYKQFGDELLHATSGVETVSIVAARREDGALTLMLVNRGDGAATVPLQIAGFIPAADAEVWRFDAEHKAEQVAALAVTADTELTLPPLSMTLLVLK